MYVQDHIHYLILMVMVMLVHLHQAALRKDPAQSPLFFTPYSVSKGGTVVLLTRDNGTIWL